MENFEDLIFWIIDNTEIDLSIKNKRNESAYDLAANSFNQNILQKMVSRNPKLYLNSTSSPQNEQRRSSRIRNLDSQKKANQLAHSSMESSEEENVSNKKKRKQRDTNKKPTNKKEKKIKK